MPTAIDNGSSVNSNDNNTNIMDSLCDNTLAHVISFLDFFTAVRLSRVTSKSLARRDAISNGHAYLWKEIHDRHYFASTPSTGSDYMDACQKRRRLFQNLLGRRNKSAACFNLPNRYFYFVPVTPPRDDDWDDDLTSPPPVHFDCHSFILSTASNGEMIFLNPFTGSVVVQTSCLDNAVMSDEAMMEQAMTDAATLITKLKTTLTEEQHIAGAVIEESVFRNHNMEHYQLGPKQVLMDMHDYFQIDLSEYFHLNRSSREAALAENEEVGIDFCGIESKPILSSNGQGVTGTMVAVGRTLSTDPEDVWDSNPKMCTEMILWRRDADKGLFDQRFVCRIRSSYKSMEMDPVFQRIYVSFPFNEGPFRRLDAYVQDEQTDHVNFDGGSRVVAAYPMEEYPEQDDANATARHDSPQHFPKPLFILKCHHPVSSVIVTTSGGTVLTATTRGTIEFWETGELGGARQTSVVDIKAALKTTKSSKSVAMEREEQIVVGDAATPSTAAAGPPMTTENNPTNIEQRMEDTNNEDEPSDEGAINPVVTSFHLPTHQSIDHCGFMTLHHVHGQNSSLLLWSKSSKDGATFEIVSTITLPLSSRRKPRVHYDGRRLIVCGQDHIGMIILVYRILNSWEDLEHFVDLEPLRKGKGDESAGISNLTTPHRIKYGNRVRHAALGGLEFYDSLYMTANERFVVINTKTGNLLGGGSTPATDGLLVIDLEEYA